ncbi:TRAFs-binding domain-containing protein [Aquimonas sp.]|jgi:hypothetical protein|uniref:TRAFs-binding domain-containing protein n=1 Tax=Aquimonas sp. TaxID=1872588 RepID=UPI0037C18053
MQTCFVIMGFGKKTDFRQSKDFDLDKTYRTIIRPAVLAAGLECVRADEELSAGLIDVPMYQRLHTADVVIADLSTSNLNAMYELGVRHVLKPRTTIVIAEEGFQNPFDTSHLRILRYQHLGPGIEFEEVERVRAVLVDMIQAASGAAQADSPVYTFLPSLQPPAFAAAIPTKMDGVPAPGHPTFAAQMAEAMAAKAADNFEQACEVLQRVRDAQGERPDAYVVQQLALATYKSKRPNPPQALFKAREILRVLKPEHSNDPETLGLWGAIHKRLAELPADQLSDDARANALETAITAYQKGFILQDDHYNGINYAFLLDSRAKSLEGEERIADRVEARRVRKRVVARARQMLSTGFSHLQDPVVEAEQRFWVRASLVEALCGSNAPEADAELALLKAGGAPQNWMLASLQAQLGALRDLQRDST